MKSCVKKVLYVDDSPTMRQIIDLVFKQAGFEVMLAEDAMHALHYLEYNHFDVIVTDFNMPKMNGVEFTKQAKLLPNHRATPIVMLTPEMSDQKMEEGKLAGVRAWVNKPIKPDKLIHVVEKLLSVAS
jgi:two-component system, chemotaxis family, chemotaxis protein CheY